MADHQTAKTLLSQIAFVILVILIPIGSGIGYVEHKRTNDVRKLQRIAALHAVDDDWELHDGLVAACRRNNSVRMKQNLLIVALDIPTPLNLIVMCEHVWAKPDHPRLSRNEMLELKRLEQRGG